MIFDSWRTNTRQGVYEYDGLVTPNAAGLLELAVGKERDGHVTWHLVCKGFLILQSCVQHKQPGIVGSYF